MNIGSLIDENSEELYEVVSVFKKTQGVIDSFFVIGFPLEFKIG